jgi:hypothetical protein
MSETGWKPKRTRKNAGEIFHVERVKKLDKGWKEPENAQAGTHEKEASSVFRESCATSSIIGYGNTFLSRQTLGSVSIGVWSAW